MRQIVFNFFSVLVFSFTISSCVKETITPGTSTLTIVNGVVGSKGLLTNFKEPNSTITIYKNLFNMSYGSFRFFNSYSGPQKLSLYQLPRYDGQQQASLRLNAGFTVKYHKYSFLTGTVQSPEYVTTMDEIPSHAIPDSTMGIRFINLSRDNALVSVNLAGRANGSETESLSYKSVTTFKKYSASAAISSYTFEFRDKVTGMLLGNCKLDGINSNGTQTPNIMRYRNFTLAFLGAPTTNALNRVLRIDATVKQ